MLNPSTFYLKLKEFGFNFFTGVPDSLLKEICSVISDTVPKQDHIIAPNEGTAIGLATGYYLATGNPAFVYMQNSGLGNAINPLLTLADIELFSIPMLIMIGWRGQPGFSDEPQHIKQGRITVDLLESLDIPSFVLSSSSNSEEILSNAISDMNKRSGPTVLLVTKGTFREYLLPDKNSSDYSMTRERAINCILTLLNNDELIVSTTGMASRELIENKFALNQDLSNVFPSVGAMGHVSAIALGIALSAKSRKVICLDGDGSILMHMGNLTIIGKSLATNLVHIVINNGAHDSVGGQPTVGLKIDLVKIALACGYTKAKCVSSETELSATLKEFKDSDGPVFLEIRVKKGFRSDLGRPKSTPLETRNAFMRNCR